MISHEISYWDISVVQVIQVMQMIQVIEVIQVIQERLAYLWCESTLELFFSASLIHIRHPHNMRPFICNTHLDFALPSINKGWQRSYVKDDFVSKLHFVVFVFVFVLRNVFVILIGSTTSKKKQWHRTSLWFGQNLLLCHKRQWRPSFNPTWCAGQYHDEEDN